MNCEWCGGPPPLYSCEHELLCYGCQTRYLQEYVNYDKRMINPYAHKYH